MRVWRFANAAVGVDALVDLEAQMARDEWLGHFQEQVVQVVAMFAGDLIGVPKAPGGEQGGTRAFALDDRVGDQGGAVDDVLDVFSGGLGALQGIGENVGHRLRRI